MFERGKKRKQEFWTSHGKEDIVGEIEKDRCGYIVLLGEDYEKSSTVGGKLLAYASKQRWQRRSRMQTRIQILQPWLPVLLVRVHRGIPWIFRRGLVLVMEVHPSSGLASSPAMFTCSECWFHSGSWR